MVLATTQCLTRGREDGVYFDALAAFSVAAIMGSLMYNLWPMTGPGNLFGDVYQGSRFIPWHSPPPPTNLRLLEAPLDYSRRAMPSMHCTFGLLAALTMMRDRRAWLRRLAWVFMLMTLFSAAYVGHYLIDFLVALPLTLLNVAMTGRRALTTSRARCEMMLLSLGMLGVCYYGFLAQAEALVLHPGVVIAAELTLLGLFVWGEARLAGSGSAQISTRAL
jgi:hypothetical protein